jgi:hypothetical protein
MRCSEGGVPHLGDHVVGLQCGCLLIVSVLYITTYDRSFLFIFENVSTVYYRLLVFTRFSVFRGANLPVYSPFL